MTSEPYDHEVPVFAVLGHPNEGKSSVVSTLIEDDQIPISQVPGETSRSRSYTVKIDGRPIIRFVDTPGFQVPRQTLAWLREHPGPDCLDRFISDHRTDPFFSDECELLSPVAKGRASSMWWTGPGRCGRMTWPRWRSCASRAGPGWR